VIDEVGEDRYNAEPDRYWTAQQGGLPDSGQVTARGPQMYLREQLPDPEVSRVANFTPQEIPENIVLDGDDAWDHPRGPEPSELIRLAKSGAVKERMIGEAHEKPSEAGLFSLTDSSMDDVRRAQEEADTPHDSGDGHEHADDEIEPGEATESGEQTTPEGGAKTEGQGSPTGEFKSEPKSEKNKS
jgi:hypothetical protein